MPFQVFSVKDFVSYLHSSLDASVGESPFDTADLFQNRCFCVCIFATVFVGIPLQLNVGMVSFCLVFCCRFENLGALLVHNCLLLQYVLWNYTGLSESAIDIYVLQLNFILFQIVFLAGFFLKRYFFLDEGQLVMAIFFLLDGLLKPKMMQKRLIPVKNIGGTLAQRSQVITSFHVFALHAKISIILIAKDNQQTFKLVVQFRINLQLQMYQLIYLILLMSRLQKSNLNLSYGNNHHEGRSLALPIAAPVLEEYNYIDLRKQSQRRRIDHLVLSQLPTLSQSNSESSKRARWQKSLDRYMLAKQELQSRRGQTQINEFQFLRLDKINRYRKIKLVEAHSLPLSIISSTDLHENYSFDHDPQTSTKARRVNTEKETFHHSPKSEMPQQQRIMNSILENYFKKKYSLPRKHIMPKSQKYASALQKKQKQKIKF